MVSAIDQVTAKLGEEKRIVQQQAETITGSSLQQGQLDTYAFGVECLRRRRRLTGNIDMLQYGSVIKLLEYLRHRNPDCWGTVGTYIPTLKMLCGVQQMTPDQLIENYQSADENQLEALFLGLDQHWIQRNEAPSTRIIKWSVLSTFLKANGIRRIKLIDMNITNHIVCDDEAMTIQDCQRAFEACRNTGERVLISLFIETLQRPSSIQSLTWGDVLPHILNKDSIFLIKIGSKRTKRNFPHWAPIGPLSSHYLTELLASLHARGITPQPGDPLIYRLYSNGILKPIAATPFFMRLIRILERAGIRGQKQDPSRRARYIKHPQGFRKFGRISMQDAGAPDEAIEHLMGHRTSTYSKWLDRKEELLKIYMRTYPRLDEATATERVIDFANRLGLSLDPKALHKLGECGNIQVHGGPSQGSEATAGA